MSVGSMPEEGLEQNTRRRLQTVAKATAVTGGPMFLLGVVLHPARDGVGIAAAGQVYGATHGLQAISLLLLAVSLVSVYVLGAQRFGRRGLPAFLTAVVGTLLWFGLIVLDGTRNPVTAQYAPDIVHTSADLDVGGAIIVLPALLVFPLGYALLALLLTRQGARWPGLLTGIGAVVYWTGGLAIFALGPHSPVIQALEVAGALPYALGFVLLAADLGGRPAEARPFRSIARHDMEAGTRRTSTEEDSPHGFEVTVPRWSGVGGRAPDHLRRVGAWCAETARIHAETAADVAVDLTDLPAPPAARREAIAGAE